MDRSLVTMDIVSVDAFPDYKISFVFVGNNHKSVYHDFVRVMRSLDLQIDSLKVDDIDRISLERIKANTGLRKYTPNLQLYFEEYEVQFRRNLTDNMNKILEFQGIIEMKTVVGLTSTGDKTLKLKKIIKNKNKYYRFLNKYNPYSFDVYDFLEIIKSVPRIHKYVKVIRLNNFFDKLKEFNVYSHSNFGLDIYEIILSQKLIALLTHYNKFVLHEYKLKLYIEILESIFIDIDFNDKRSFEQKIDDYAKQLLKLTYGKKVDDVIPSKYNLGSKI